MEQDESPLGRVYRELGLPVIGEGRYASTSYDPRATLPQGPLEQVRRWLDPNYAANRQLLAEQDLGLHRLATAGPLIQGTRNLERPTLADAQSQYPDFPIPPLAYERAGPGGGYDMTTPLPPTFQALLQAKHHNTSLKQPTSHAPGEFEQKMGIGMPLGIQAFREKNKREPTPAEVFDIFGQVANIYDKAPLPGSAPERKLKAEAGIAEAEQQARPEKLAAELDKTSSEKANLDQTREHEKLMLPYKIAKLVADIQLAHTQSSNVGQKAALSDLLGQVHEARSGLMWMSKANLLSPDDAAKVAADLHNKLNSQLEMITNDRSWGEKYVPFMKKQPIEVKPRDGVKTQAPPQVEEAPLPPPSSERFKGAPKGKNPGALLKDSSGRPVARWDGSQWIPLEGQ